MTDDRSQGEAGDLEEARARIAAVDASLMALVAERMRLAERVGEAKRRLGLPVRNYGTEAEVLARYREAGAAAGVDPEQAEALAGLMIDAAVRRQESVAARPDGAVRRVVIVGGAGKMGRWFAQFFESQGHEVGILDPALPDDDPRKVPGSSIREADIVLVATPLSATAEALATVIGAGPTGLVMDIASLKSPVQDQLQSAAARGLRVASLHPLFGPAVRTLGGRIMAVCDCGHREAADLAATLFAETAVTVTRLRLEDHDRYMQLVLGLSHLVSLVFAATVSRSGISPAELAGMASTTWLKQARTAAEVVAEDPRLYYEIQHLNRHSRALFDRVREALDHLEAAAFAETPGQFEEIMLAARAFLPAVPGRLLS